MDRKEGQMTGLELLPYHNSHVDRQLPPGLAVSPGLAGQLAGCPTRGLTWAGAVALVPIRTQNFHHFLKLALTKNPKKRPTAEKLLQVGEGDDSGA